MLRYTFFYILSLLFRGCSFSLLYIHTPNFSARSSVDRDFCLTCALGVYYRHFHFERVYKSERDGLQCQWLSLHDVPFDYFGCGAFLGTIGNEEEGRKEKYLFVLWEPIGFCENFNSIHSARVLIVVLHFRLARGFMSLR